MTRTQEIMEEHKLGANLCKKIKHIYFNDKTWVDAHEDVAKKFTMLKRIMRHIYPDHHINEILNQLNNFNANDLDDVFASESSLPPCALTGKTGSAVPKYGDRVHWFPIPKEKIAVLPFVKDLVANFIPEKPQKTLQNSSNFDDRLKNDIEYLNEAIV